MVRMPQEWDPVTAQVEGIFDAIFGDEEEPPPLDLDPEPGYVGAFIPEPVPTTAWDTTLTAIIEELSRGVYGDVQPNTGFTSYSVSEILDLIAVSRDPNVRIKGTNWTVAGYPMTVGGYTQWRDDVNYLLNYVAGKDYERYDSFLGYYGDIDPDGFTALVGAFYHTEEQQPIDIQVLVDTDDPPPLVDVWPPYSRKPVDDPVPPDDPVDEEPEIFMPDLEHEQPVPWPETFMPDLEHEQPVPWDPDPPTVIVDRPWDRRYWPWVRPMGPEARPHSPHAPFGPRRPADWPYADAQMSLEYGPDDTTLNLGPDDWGAPPGTPAVFVERLPDEPKGPEPLPPYHDFPPIEEIYGYGGDPRHPGVQMQPADDVYQLIGGELAELYPGGYRVNTGLRPIGEFMGGRRQ